MKSLPSVIGRVDVYELHLAGIALLQELEHFQVVALEHQVLRRVPIDALLGAGTEGNRWKALGRAAAPGACRAS